MSEANDGARSGGPEGKTVRTGGKNRRIQEIDATDRYWGEEADEAFFAALAATCNVQAAAKAAGFSTATAYDHRKKFPQFAERWQAALDHGYIRLEMALLEAAQASLSSGPWDNERPIPPLTTDEIVKVLKLHQATVKLGHPARRGNVGTPLPLEAVKDDIKRKVRAIIAKRSTTPKKAKDGE